MSFGQMDKRELLSTVKKGDLAAMSVKWAHGRQFSVSYGILGHVQNYERIALNCRKDESIVK